MDLLDIAVKLIIEQLYLLLLIISSIFSLSKKIITELQKYQLTFSDFFLKDLNLQFIIPL